MPNWIGLQHIVDIATYHLRYSHKVWVQKRHNGRIWYGTKVFAKVSLDKYLMIVSKGI
jgi:hypothetical protein